MQKDSPNMLILENVSKSFGRREILSSLNLEIQNKTICTLMGANGAGKTTLFNVITGFLRADSGEVRFKDQRLSRLSPITINKLGITRTFQNNRLIGDLTVEENVLLSFKCNRGERLWNAIMPPSRLRDHYADFKSRARRILKDISLHDQANAKSNELSFGQQKLLTIGCCIANNADLLLLDEPVASINPKLRENICSIIKELKSAGKAIFLIEHNPEFIKPISDKLYFLRDGQVSLYNDYNQLRDDPRVIEAFL